MMQKIGGFKMKKALSLFLAVLMILSLTACAQGPSEKKAKLTRRRFF